MRIQDAGRLGRTLVHLRPAQVWHRVRLSARRAWWNRRQAAIDARYRARAANAQVAWDHPGLAAVAEARLARRPAASAAAIAEDALAGRFTLLGETRSLGWPVGWDRPDLMEVLLWKTHLHEFGWALDLGRQARLTGDRRFRDGFFALARSWAESQPIARRGFHRVAWNERVVATRLGHWACVGSLLGLRPCDPDADWLAREIVRHAAFLRDNLALDLQANHLFRDCVALAFAHEIAGCAPDGLALLEREVREQILPDGAHYERSPMYHAVCVEDLIDVCLVLGERAPAWLVDALRRAGGFLDAMRLGDGDLALLGDAWRGEVHVDVVVEQARAAAGGLEAPREPERWSGLVPLARGPVRAVIRAGAHGPDHQLGHAHADLLSFDLSRGPARLVTDTGTGTYAAGPARARLRSTAAHNTIALDGQELLEAWSSFRSGRRGRARCVARGESAGFAWIAAVHDGWRWLAGSPMHHRLLAVSAEAACVVDLVAGRGVHRVASRLHLHPDAPPGAVHVYPLAGKADRTSAPLHERYGETREMAELCVEWEGPLPWLGGWWLRFEGPSDPPRVTLSRDGGIVRVSIEEPGARWRLRWDPDAAAPSAVEIDVLASPA